MKILNKIHALLRAFVLSATGLGRGVLFSPFASVSPSGRIGLGRRVSVKQVRLNAQHGEILLSDGVWLNDGVEINSTHRVVIGSGTTLQRNVTINGEVRIGAECLFAPNVFVSSTSHVHDYYPGLGIREQERRIPREEFLQRYNKPISIGDDVWLGANVVLMPGVSIGSHVVIGANAVVNIDIPSGTIAAGVPVRIIKKRPGFEGLADA
ncbi:DapH/DapD/GlmU-related protein [Pseudomonas alkylphenolica]|uniref:DapH/DapD/GlmU-related protein n=1 Tax=Pseudomonas alkylphenolica TaxID=237609 RepID=UPI0033987651